MTGFDLGEVEHVVEDGHQVSARFQGGMGLARLVFVKRRGEQQFGHAQHAVHRRADFVAHGGEKV